MKIQINADILQRNIRNDDPICLNLDVRIESSQHLQLDRFGFFRGIGFFILSAFGSALLSGFFGGPSRVGQRFCEGGQPLHIQGFRGQVGCEFGPFSAGVHPNIPLKIAVGQSGIHVFQVPGAFSPHQIGIELNGLFIDGARG